MANISSLTEINIFFRENGLSYEVVSRSDIVVVIEVTSAILGDVKVTHRGTTIEDALMGYLNLQLYALSNNLPMLIKYTENLLVFIEGK